MQVMKERDAAAGSRHIVQVDDAYLGGETRGWQTRTSAGASPPFVAAVQVTKPVALRMSCVKGFRKQEIAASDLRRETVVYSDGLASPGSGGSRL